ncbi:hypothetical protein CSA17_05895 [bacterium DOLJORAL78_65_58]|nr:MAG: hypothetical protein CSA17_05895 [bacterium DOLJORAL78_65_58]
MTHAIRRGDVPPLEEEVIMVRKDNPGGAPLECGACRDQMQEYLDGTLDKTSGLSRELRRI